MRHNVHLGLWCCVICLCLVGHVQPQPSNQELEPPIITNGPPKEPQYYDSENSVTLKCTATGKPAPRWKFDGREISHTGSEITIEDKSENWGAGQYQCEAHNQYGTAISNITTVIKAECVGEEVTQTKEVVAGEAYSLKCPAWASPSYKYFYWYLNGTQNVKDNNNHVVLQTNGTLYFNRLCLNHTGEYKCRILLKNSEGCFGKVKLHVLPGPPKGSLSLVYSTPSPVIALQGSTIRLQCIFSNDPGMTLKWINGNGETLSPGKRLGTLKVNQPGKYRCQASSHNNIVKVESEIAVDFKEPVKIQKSLWRLQATKGDKVVISCKAKHQIETIWYINNNRIKGPGNGFDVQGYNLSINTEKLTMSAMTITCNTTDMFTYDMSSTFLIIKDKTPGEPTPNPSHAKHGPGGPNSLLVIVIAVVIFIIVCAVGCLVGYMIRELRKARNQALSIPDPENKNDNRDEENKENERRRREHEEYPLIKAGSKENNAPIIIVVQQPQPAQQQDDAADNGEDSGIEEEAYSATRRAHTL